MTAVGKANKELAMMTKQVKGKCHTYKCNAALLPMNVHSKGCKHVMLLPGIPWQKIALHLQTKNYFQTYHKDDGSWDVK